MLGVQAGEAVLEISCGTGKAMAELSQRAGEMGCVCGLDLSAGMLHMARSTLVKAGLTESTHPLAGDGMWLPFPSQQFDAIFMSFTLELFDTPEIPQVLAECWRALKLGGRLEVVALSKPERAHWIVRLYEWFHQHLPAYVDCRLIDAERMIQAAGFAIVQKRSKLMWGLPVVIALAIKTHERT
jgi:demethylmenaquinone methyltransferase/2-methoxy-6-polyprenyl-1,4-benzoquinol methylase